MLYDRHDQVVGRSVELYGEYLPDETSLIKQTIRPGWMVVEVGADIGTHAITFSRLVGPRGMVIAFEPRRLAFQTLCANVALNSITNVHCRPEAVRDAGGRVSVPVRDEEGPAEPAGAITLDSIELSHCHFLKIDASGAELAVVQGAAKTIQKHRPILYISADRRDQLPALIESLRSQDYTVYWHTPRLFSPENSYKNTTNELGPGLLRRIFGVHSSVATEISGLQRIEEPNPQRA